MSRAARYAAMGLAVAIALLLVACGSSGGSSLSGGGSSDGGGTPTCDPLPVMSNWTGFYTACANASRTYGRLTNVSDWDVLLLQVPAGVTAPSMDMSPPAGSSLADLVEQAEFPGSSGGSYALVPPGATLTSASQDGSPLNLTLSIDFSSTAGNVTAMGLVNVIGDRMNPGEAEAHAIVTCASYVDSLPDQINQTQPNSAEFWNNFASTAECSQAFQTASDALDLSGETAATQDSEIAEDAENITSHFFDDVLPKLISLAADAVFH